MSGKLADNREELLGELIRQLEKLQSRTSGSGERIYQLNRQIADVNKAECTLSIHMQNDTVKGKGYGTQAERLAVKIAFEEMGMTAVNADTIMKNTRSQHVLEKAGFRFVGDDGSFKYYRIER